MSALQYKPTIETTMQRLAAFWSKELVDRPPIRIRYPVPGMSDEQWPKAGVDPVELYEYWDNLCRLRADFADDEIPALQLDMGPGFMGGVMGSRVWYDHGTTWSEHSLSDLSALDELAAVSVAEGNSWIERLVNAAGFFGKKSAGKCAVAVAMLTGPGDVMTALRGPGELCTDLFENPAGMRRLAEICTAALEDTARIQFDSVPSYNGGYVDNYNIWTPGRSAYFADDFSILLSAEQYREFFYPYDCRTAEIFNTPWLHVHSGGARLVPEFRTIPGLRAIQIVNDRPAGPTVSELLPIFKLIQQQHCLLLRKYSREELEQVLPELSPYGLYVDTQADSEEQAWQILEWWNRRWS